ncbi:MAG: hypothetical protein AB8B69_02455 [Chitinophagales bacterium]
MLTIEKELELMRLYFNGKLKGKALASFEQKMRADEALRQRVFVEKMVFEAAYELFAETPTAIGNASMAGLQKAKSLAEELEEDLFGEEGDSWQDIAVDIDVEPVYTLKELLAFFKPIEHFESANRRSQSVGSAEGLDDLVKQPSTGLDCKAAELNFELKEAVPIDLELTILNNQEDILLTQIIEANTLIFNVSLSFLQSKIGKYYWRLKANTRDRGIRKQYKSVIRSFFLNKGLNPYS